VRGFAYGALIGAIAAGSLILLVVSEGGGEGEIGASYLAMFLGWPVSNILLLSETLAWIRYWKEFVALSFILNWGCFGGVIAILAGLMRRST
jgi:hypothetical protein